MQLSPGGAEFGEKCGEKEKATKCVFTRRYKVYIRIGIFFGFFPFSNTAKNIWLTDDNWIFNVTAGKT